MSVHPDSTETDTRAVSARPAASAPPPPTQLPEINPSHYEVHGELARGGMGRILHATDLRLGRKVAIKQLLISNERRARLFEREIRISARLQHPSIVNIYEAGRLPTGELFYAMKLVAGRPLSEAIDRTTTVGERLALLPAVTAVCDALAYAHQQRIIHRDLKPSNVLVGDFGETVVIDWGLAKDLERPDDSQPLADAEAHAPEHTVSGHAVGTPAYMAPEQARGDEVDERSDVYALGAMIYHVLSARAPYRGERAQDIVAQVRAGAPPALESVEPGLPSDLYTLVARAMSRDPGQRYPSAVQLVDDLRRFQTGKLITAHHYSRRELVARWVARNRAVVSVMAAAVVVLAVLLVVGFGSIIRERDLASSRANGLTVSKAALMLERDPAGAIATLQTLPPGAEQWGAARVIASAARERGIGVVRVRRAAAVTALGTAPQDGAVAVASEDGAVALLEPGGDSTELWSHTGPVAALAFDGSGRWLASASRDASIRLHDRAAGTSHTLSAHEQPIVHLAFAPDGASLASVDSGGTVRLWDLRALTSVVAAQVAAPVAALGFVGDRPVALGRDATGSPARSAMSRDGTRTAVVEARAGHTQVTGLAAPLAVAPEHLVFSPDGALLATRGPGSGAMVWDLANGQGVALAHGSAVSSLAFLAGGALVATGGRDGVIRIWDTEGRRLRELVGHLGDVVTLAASPGGDVLHSGSVDRTVRAWHVLPLSPRQLTGHRAGVARVAFSGDGGAIISAGWDSTVRVWDVATGTSRVVGSHVGALRALAVAGDSIATGGDDRAVRVWSTDGQVARTLGTHQASVLAVAMSSDGALVASGGRDNAVRVWRSDGASARLFHRHRGAVNEVAFSPDGRWLASASSDGTARARDLTTDREHVVTHGDAVRAVVFAPDASWFASAGLDGSIRITSLRTGNSRTLTGHADAVRDLAVSADGRWLASASDDMTARVWNVADGTARVFTGHRDYVGRVGFDPRTFALLTASEDGTVSIWDIDSGTRRVLVAGQWLADAAISPDGTHVAGCGADDAILLWRDDLPVASVELHAWLVAQVSR